jgi:tRNA(Leu) C34 or U34 (ribose-2'-O)-methylase TrmL
MGGYFGIGIYHNKSKRNIGTLWRSAQLFEASFVFTILTRYRWQPTDTFKSWRNVPFFHHESVADFQNSIPFECELVGIELTEDAIDIVDFKHPKQAIYLLGAEDTGLPPEILALCTKVIKLPGKYSMNVSTAGSLVMYDRYLQTHLGLKKKDLALQSINQQYKWKTE